MVETDKGDVVVDQIPQFAAAYAADTWPEGHVLAHRLARQQPQPVGAVKIKAPAEPKAKSVAKTKAKTKAKPAAKPKTTKTTPKAAKARAKAKAKG